MSRVEKNEPSPGKGQNFCSEAGAAPSFRGAVQRHSAHGEGGAHTRGPWRKRPVRAPLAKPVPGEPLVSAFSPGVWLCEACSPECDLQADGMNSCYPHSDEYLMGN